MKIVIRIKPLIFGVVLLALASVGFLFAFGVADFSSAVRDDFEKQRGVTDYSVFTLTLLACAALFLAGVRVLWVSARKSAKAQLVQPKHD